MSDDYNAPDFTLERIFEKLVNLPTFPKVIQKALALLKDPNSSIAKLAELLRYDPAITANILRFTNSAHFGLAQRITDLETALTFLGQQHITEILLASASLPYLNTPIAGYRMEPRDLWRHSIATAIAAETLAKFCSYPDPPTAFTGALLHDIGKIALNIFVGGRLEDIFQMARQEKMIFTEAEWRVLGGDHAVIGAEILQLWEFPSDIVRAVRNHHDPDLYIQDTLSSLMALANILVIQMGIGLGADAFRYNINFELLDRLHLTRADLHRCIVLILMDFNRSQDMLNLD
ncbi:MAG: HDOD domain-containing protein [Dissulfuribacterales bacterium]